MTLPTFSWGSINDLIAAVVDTDDSLEILRDDADVQFVRTTIAPSRGRGVIEYLCDSSMRVLVMDGHLDQGLHIEVVDNGWIRLNFSVRIAIDMSIGDAVSVNENGPSWRLFRLPPGSCSIETVPAGADFRWVTICCAPEQIAAIAGIGLDDLPFRSDHGEGEDTDLIYRPYRFSHFLFAATNDMFERRSSDLLRAAQVSARARELLILALDHLLHDQSVAAFVGMRLTDRDIAALDATRAYIDEHLSDRCSIAMLSREMGINRNKLFYGFRNRFGMTVSEYVAAQRLREGMRLLIETEEPLTAISAAIGFGHQCNFSTAFKKQFGVSPRVIRRRRDT